MTEDALVKAIELLKDAHTSVLGLEMMAGKPDKEGDSVANKNIVKVIAILSAQPHDAEGQRVEVKAYAQSMENELRENDHKGGWKDCPTDYLIEKLIEETTELIACFVKPDPDGIANLADQFKIYLAAALDDSFDKTSEAADVGNVAMMLADSTREASQSEAQPLTREDKEAEDACPAHGPKCNPHPDCIDNPNCSCHAEGLEAVTREGAGEKA